MSYKHLSREEQYTISILRRKGDSRTSIAASIGRSVSTINRELSRNSTDAGGYRYEYAQKLAKRRSIQASCRSQRIDQTSWSFAKTKLTEEQWSPEQIAGELKELGMSSIIHETIYQRIYKDLRRQGELYQHLRHKVKSYKNRSLKNDKRGQIANQTSIEQRPDEVDLRLSIGHWEIDTIMESPLETF